jgi:hypothetical protein
VRDGGEEPDGIFIGCHKKDKCQYIIEVPFRRVGRHCDPFPSVPMVVMALERIQETTKH